MTAPTMKRIAAGCLLVILAVFVADQANASGNFCQYCEVVPGPPGADGMDGADGFDGMDTGLSESDFAEGLSLAFAMAGIDFTSTTTKLQVGVAGSWYDGKNSIAAGIAQVIDSDDFGDVMLSLKVGAANGHNAGVVSGVWNIQ